MNEKKEKLFVRNLTKTYSDGFTAVKNVNLSVSDGEFLVLLGPSGCGKTTLLRTIIGLEDISKGEIFLGGREIKNLPSSKRNIAMVFQNYALFPHMNVFDNISFGMKIRRLPKAEIQSQVERVSQVLGIKDLLNKRPKELSGGQRQRVAVGRALARKPALFLFDEPLSNLDAKLRLEMRNELLDLHNRLSFTAIYVTHDQVEAMTLGTRICIMKGGMVLQIGKPMEIYGNPQNVFIASFLGSPSMNIVKGKLEKKSEDKFLINGIELSKNDYIEYVYELSRGKEIHVGIRPQKISLRKENNFIKAKVVLVELLGDYSIIYFKLNKKRLIASISEVKNIKIGDDLNFYFSDESVYFFDDKENLIKRV